MLKTLELLVHKDLLDQQVHKDHKVLQEQLGHKDLLVLQVQLDLKDLLGHFRMV
eukprot:gene1330-1303_t